MFKSLNTALNISCGRTKLRAIVEGVLDGFFIEKSSKKAYNTNTNFGGKNQGQESNVFLKLNGNLTLIFSV